MSVAHTTPAHAADAAGEGRRRTSTLGWIAGGTSLAAILATVAIAVWPASETEKARADGEKVGEAVTSLYEAQSTAEVDAALAELDAAVVQTAEHAGDEVADQMAAQEDALSRAAEGFTGALSSDDEFEADLYQAEVEYAVDDLGDNASDFRAQGPEVRQAFYEGYLDGRSGS